MEKTKKVKVDIKENKRNLHCGDGQLRDGKGNRDDEC